MAPFQPSNILILGGIGNIGYYIADAIIKAQPPFKQITVFIRKDSASKKQAFVKAFEARGVKVVTGDLETKSDIQAIYEGIDTVVSALGRDALERQIDLIREAEASDSVKWFIPSEYGTDIEYGPSSAAEKPHQLKLKVRRALREDTKRLEHTFVVTGPYSDMYFNLSDKFPEVGGFDAARKKAVLIEDGEGKIGFTTMPDVGKAVVAVLRQPEASFGKAIKVQSFVVTPKQILAEFEKQTGGEKWNVSYTPLQSLKEAEQKAWSQTPGTATLYTLGRIWAEGGTLYEKTDNESIGLKEAELETLEASVKRYLVTGWVPKVVDGKATLPVRRNWEKPTVVHSTPSLHDLLTHEPRRRSAIRLGAMAVKEELPVASSHKTEKKQKKEKKKRSREEDPLVTDERKHKRSKSTANRAISPDLSASANTDANDSVAEAEKPTKKSKKSKKSKQEAPADAGDAVQVVADKKKRRMSRSQDDEDGRSELKASAKKSSSKKKSKKEPTPESSEAEQASESSEDDEAENPDAMDIDTPLQPNPPKSTSRLHQPLDTPAKPRYPFFTQTVSLFLPIYPIGWAGPCTAAATQHLQPMVNRYVPVLGGVLLGFRNVAVSERPGREDAATSDSDVCKLGAIDEFAVGFGWVTADVDLFVPKRGAWMEGSINLESEGHVGVVCWGKFNASIESARLPPAWRWVHLGTDETAATSAHDDTVSNFTAEEQHGAVRQIHATGYWVDEAGQKVKGRVRFRIKAFDVGVSGDHGYLSLEGTMLDAAGEAEARQRDAQQELRRRKGKSGGVLRKERRYVPDFSITKFGEVENEEEKALAQEVWEHTEPAKDAAETAQDGEYAGLSHEAA
ncbi:RNA polymerase Rpb7-like domain-containing protein [Verticillium dahliae]